MTASLSPWDEAKTYHVGSESVRNLGRSPRGKITRPFLDWILGSLEENPFKPHPLLKNGHAQTIAAYAWPRSLTMPRSDSNVERLFELEPGIKLLGHCSWQSDPAKHPTLLLVHGLEGSSSSKYMVGTAEKAFHRGFNVIRLNLRTCGGTEHLTPTLYHSGMTDDLRAVVRELIECDHLRSIFLVGFSMGGNMVLKLAGEDPDALPKEVSGFCAVSPAIDLSSCAEAIRYRSNWVYEQMFLRSLRRRLVLKHELYPERYDISDLHLVHTIRDFDERYTCHDGGFRNADDYYKRASALPLIKRIRKPSLVIHAQDDPFIPFVPFRDSSIIDNSYIVLLAPQHGGHVGFIADHMDQSDRFWAEDQIVDFCQHLHSLPHRRAGTRQGPLKVCAVTLEGTVNLTSQDGKTVR